MLRTLLGALLIAVIQNGLNLLNVNSDRQMVVLARCSSRRRVRVYCCVSVS